MYVYCSKYACFLLLFASKLTVPHGICPVLVILRVPSPLGACVNGTARGDIEPRLRALLPTLSTLPSTAPDCKRASVFIKINTQQGEGAVIFMARFQLCFVDLLFCGVPFSTAKLLRRSLTELKALHKDKLNYPSCQKVTETMHCRQRVNEALAMYSSSNCNRGCGPQLVTALVLQPKTKSPRRATRVARYDERRARTSALYLYCLSDSPIVSGRIPALQNIATETVQQ